MNVTSPYSVCQTQIPDLISAFWHPPFTCLLCIPTAVALVHSSPDHLSITALVFLCVAVHCFNQTLLQCDQRKHFKSKKCSPLAQRSLKHHTFNIATKLVILMTVSCFPLYGALQASSLLFQAKLCDTLKKLQTKRSNTLKITPFHVVSEP